MWFATPEDMKYVGKLERALGFLEIKFEFKDNDKPTLDDNSAF
jgi:hypothetical protein